MAPQPSTHQPVEDAARVPPGCCEANHQLSKQEIASDVETLAAIANDTRYETLRLISAAEGDVCVCELEPVLGVSQGAVSQALSRLFTAGLVTRRKQGRWRYYAATERADRLLETLDTNREQHDG